MSNNLRVSFSRRKDSPVFDTLATYGTETLPPMLSSLIAAMDKQTTCRMKTGENGHVEHAWSTTDSAIRTQLLCDIQESITQLYFQLVRTKSETALEELSVQLESILQTLSMMNSDQSSNTYLSIMFRMLLQTRDLVSGKGEYTLSYWMILSWYKYFPALAVYALKTFVMSDDVGEAPPQPFGSWKDMKYMADLCKKQTGNANHELIRTCIQLVNAQLRIDVISAETEHSPISLCAKWVPREGSRYSWFFHALAEDFYNISMVSDTIASKKYAYTHYRKMVAGLNRRLDTVQIKQCANVWSDIDHHKTTSITLSRNKKAFLNITKKGEKRSNLPDRIECARKFTEYVEDHMKSGKEIKGKCVGMNDFTKQALALINHDYNTIRDQDADTIINKIHKIGTEIDLLNAQWRSNMAAMNSKSLVSELYSQKLTTESTCCAHSRLGNMVAMVDVSGSMEGDPLHAAIALGIRVAEKSILGKRVLTFSTTPTWHNLEGKDEFVSMVESLKDAKWGGSTNFYAALKMILDALIAQQVPPKDVEGLVLAIFSDMQINEANPSYKRSGGGSMRDTIHLMYQDAGYTCPHILFWNLRSTSGFPSLSSTPNTSMMSGFSPALLNVFCEKGLEALQTATPWNMMLETLNHERYRKIQSQIVEDR